ncbi:coiled-coil domain-containing protein 42 like-2-like [Anoplophora glabripennis]|uniref:coiled-coil domain-containing protein 42 like-2-like n=1 Tax=Anoplophora glabripennis TaxID=217634 RepID=UPI0008736574|nr:coiled-coil domain-containing protein 42 like-2-like [Anoplophora glabripennis]
MELAQKEKTLRENFLFFNSFVRENMEKRERAKHKIVEDVELCDQRQKEIESLKKNHDEIQKAKVDMDAKIKEYHMYEVFLDEVVEHSGEFQNIQELINRYLSLVNAKNQLAHFQEDNLVALENARSDMMKIIEEKNLVIMGLNNQIASLQARFENANIKSLECEQLVTRIKNNAVRIMNEIDEVKSSVWNVYVHMAHSKKHPVKIKKENVEEQALYIKRTLTELSKINTILRKPAKLAKMKLKSA